MDKLLKRQIVCELDTDQCAQVALYMYENWKKEMEPPVFRVMSFQLWLERLINQEAQND